MLRNYNNYQVSPFRQHAYNQAAIADHYNDVANQQRYSSNAGVNHRGYESDRSIHDHGRMASTEAGNMMQQAMRAMETGLNHEMTQVQDRKMDLADNEQGRKNLETEYQNQYQQAVANNERAKISAAERMNAANNEGLSGLMDGMNSSFSGVSSEGMEIPSYNLYGRDGRRIGGDYFGKALLG